jgi:hypothetical protein
LQFLRSNRTELLFFRPICGGISSEHILLITVLLV